MEGLFICHGAASDPKSHSYLIATLIFIRRAVADAERHFDFGSRTRQTFLRRFAEQQALDGQPELVRQSRQTKLRARNPPFPHRKSLPQSNPGQRSYPGATYFRPQFELTGYPALDLKPSLRL